MSFERDWAAVLQAFTSDGTVQGTIQVADTTGFYVKQRVILSSNTQQPTEMQIQRVVGANTLYVGLISDPITTYRDVSKYLLADSAIIQANEQKKTVIPKADQDKYSYEQEPINARRVIGVDPHGDPYDANNPLPVAFSASFPNVVEIASGDGSGNKVLVNGDGSFNVHVESGPSEPTKYINKFTAVSSVASGVLTTIGTYTVPVLKTAVMSKIEFTGTNVAQYSILVNSVEQARKITYFGGSFNESVDFTSSTSDGYPLNVGDTITVTVIHSSVFLGDFTSRIQVLELG